jgi:hypothetical protein
MDEYINDINKIDSNQIVLSYIGKNIKPRYILGANIYPISIELKNCFIPFGIDNAFGKLYMKIKIPNTTEHVNNIYIIKNIETKLSNLIVAKENGLLEDNLNKNIIQCVLDKDITIVDNSNNNVSIFSITKGLTVNTIQILLGDIFYISKIKKFSFKWIVNKIVL